MSLTFEAFRDLLAGVLRQIPDQRDPSRITWEMPAALMSAFAMLFFQHPNLLEYQRRMKKKSGRSNLERIFQVEDIPKASCSSSGAPRRPVSCTTRTSTPRLLKPSATA